MSKKAILWAVLLIQISLFSVVTVSADQFPWPDCFPGCRANSSN